MFEGITGRQAPSSPLEIISIRFREEQIPNVRGTGRRPFVSNLNDEGIKNQLRNTIEQNGGLTGSQILTPLIPSMLVPNTFAEAPFAIASGWSERRYSFQMYVHVRTATQYQGRTLVIDGYTDSTNGIDLYSKTISPGLRFYINGSNEVVTQKYSLSVNMGSNFSTLSAIQDPALHIARDPGVTNLNGICTLRPCDVVKSNSVHEILAGTVSNGNSAVQQRVAANRTRANQSNGNALVTNFLASRPSNNDPNSYMFKLLTALNDSTSIHLANEYERFGLRSSLGNEAGHLSGFSPDYPTDDECPSGAGIQSGQTLSIANGALAMLTNTEPTSMDTQSSRLNTLFASTSLSTGQSFTWGELVSLDPTLVERNGCPDSQRVKVDLLEDNGYSSFNQDSTNPAGASMNHVMSYSLFNQLSSLMREYGVSRFDFWATNETIDGSWALQPKAFLSQFQSVNDQRQNLFLSRVRASVLPSLNNMPGYQIRADVSMKTREDSTISMWTSDNQTVLVYPTYLESLYPPVLTGDQPTALKIGRSAQEIIMAVNSTAELDGTDIITNSIDAGRSQMSQPGVLGSGFGTNPAVDLNSI